MSELEETIEQTESQSEYIQQLVDKLVDKCCDKLDDYISYVAERLNSPDYVLSDKELDDIILTIPIQLYFVGSQQEKLGVKRDVSETNRKLLFNEMYTKAVGAAGVRKSEAEQNLFYEDMTIVVYNRAYETIKSKVEFATEILQSSKKIVSRRMAELELSRVSPNRTQG